MNVAISTPKIVVIMTTMMMKSMWEISPLITKMSLHMNDMLVLMFKMKWVGVTMILIQFLMENQMHIGI